MGDALIAGNCDEPAFFARAGRDRDLPHAGDHSIAPFDPLGAFDQRARQKYKRIEIVGTFCSVCASSTVTSHLRAAALCCIAAKSAPPPPFGAVARVSLVG
jgi:hypothetical protein